MKHTIHGHTIDITEPDDNEIVSDIIVITRTITLDPDGRPEESISIDATTNTTGTLQIGMLAVASEYVASPSPWGEDQDDDA